jgi:hypothetical protein
VTVTQQPQPLADRIASAFERIDAHQWGYDHGFSGTYGVDPETDSFMSAALAVVQPELDARDAEIRRLTAEYERVCGLLLHFAAEAHRRKWTYDTGEEGPPSPAFAALHLLGSEMKRALDHLTAAPTR